MLVVYLIHYAVYAGEERKMVIFAGIDVTHSLYYLTCLFIYKNIKYVVINEVLGSIKTAPVFCLCLSQWGIPYTFYISTNWKQLHIYTYIARYDHRPW